MSAKSAKPIFSDDDLIVRREHLLLALNASTQGFTIWRLRGLIPPHDGREGRLQVWRLSTIRTWNPAIAQSIEQLLKIPAFAPRSSRRANARLLRRLTA